MRTLLALALPAILLAESLAAQDVEGPPGQSGLASALVRVVQAIPISDPGERDLFLELASFQEAWMKAGWGDVRERELRSGIDLTFRTDLEAVDRDRECVARAPDCPFPGNPDIVRVISLEEGREREVRAVVRREFNVTRVGAAASSFIELEVFFALETGKWVKVRRGFLRVG